MKKTILVLLLFFCVGCISVKVPKYLPDQFPYKKTYYASFDDTLKAALQALNDLGWRTTEMTSPSVFEQNLSSADASLKQVLIFTEVRQTPLILSSRYMSINVYVRAIQDGTEVEVRYISVVPVLFKNVKGYRNTGVVDKIFKRISELLEK